MKKIFCMLFVLFSFQFSAAARKSDGKVQFTSSGGTVACRIDKGYHFNKEAPASIRSADGSFQGQPLKKEENEIVFDAGKNDKKTYVLNFYVCDDEKTVCEEHQQTIENKNGKGLGATSSDANVAKNEGAAKKPSAASGKGEINKNGFIEDNFWLGLQTAKKKKQLVLVDFRAPWCPACIRLETEVFPQAAFKKATAEFVKVSLNVDLDSQKELSKKYQVKAIPTLLVMDADGNEIYRSLDYKPVAVLSAELAKVPSGKFLSYDSLKLEAEAGSQKAMLALGLREFQALNYGEAVKWMSQVKGEPLLFANSEVAYWSEKASDTPASAKTYSDVLEKWIVQLPNTFEAMVWRNEWAEKKLPKDKPVPSATKLVLEQNISKIKNALSSNSQIKSLFAKTYLGDFSGFEKVELLSQLTNSYKILNQTEYVQVTQKNTYAELQKIRLSVARPGQVLLANSYLRALDKKTEVLDWLQKLVKAYPDTYVYYSKLARFYYGEKQYADALPLAQKVVQMEQSLVLKNMQFVAEIQKGLNQKLEAQKTIDQALSLPEAKLTHNKKTADSLGELKKSL